MKYLAVAAIAIASMVMNTASAGFIPIDNFDGTPAGMQGDGIQILAGNASVAGGRLFVTSNAFGQAGFEYTGMNDIFLGSFKTLRLTDVAFTAGTVSDIVGRAFVTGGAANTEVQSAIIPATTIANGNWVFDLSSVATDQFDSVTGIRFQFTDIGGGSFEFNTESLQAVPEPTTMALIGLVSAGGGVAGWRRRKVATAV